MNSRTTNSQEKQTSGTSRRGFLARLGRLSTAVAVGMAGVLSAKAIQAGKPANKAWCCGYVSHEGFLYRCSNGRQCPNNYKGYPLWSQSEVWDCSDCY